MAQPLRLYLICSLAFFVSKPLARPSGSAPEPAGRDCDHNPDGSRTLTPETPGRDRRGVLPARVFGRDRLIRAALNNNQLDREVAAVLPKALFLLLPVFALLTMVFWRRRLPRYPAHLYVSLHLHAAWFGAFAVSRCCRRFFLVGGRAVAQSVSVVYVGPTVCSPSAASSAIRGRQRLRRRRSSPSSTPCACSP